MYGKAYDERPDFDVHGGITFADKCHEHEHGICHIPEPGEPEPVWWFGFDCGHAFDVSPKLDADTRRLGYDLRERLNATSDEHGFPRMTYKTVDYVKREIAELAKQLKTMEAK